MIAIRPAVAADLPRLMAIQRACYPEGLVESGELLKRRLRSSPSTVWVADDEPAGYVIAYLFAYRSQLGKVTPLGGDFCIRPEGDCLYLHDLAVCPEASGNGIGRKLVLTALAAAGQLGLPFCALVSVQGTAAFWRGFGFTEGTELAEEEQRVLEAYGEGPVYMTRS